VLKQCKSFSTYTHKSAGLGKDNDYDFTAPGKKIVGTIRNVSICEDNMCMSKFTTLFVAALTAGVVFAISSCSRSPDHFQSFLDGLVYTDTVMDNKYQYARSFDVQKPPASVLSTAASCFLRGDGWVLQQHESFSTYTHNPGVRGGIKTTILIRPGRSDHARSSAEELRSWTTVLVMELRMAKE